MVVVDGVERSLGPFDVHHVPGRADLDFDGLLLLVGGCHDRDGDYATESKDQFVATFDCHSPIMLALVPPSKTQDSVGRTVVKPGSKRHSFRSAR